MNVYVCARGAIFTEGGSLLNENNDWLTLLAWGFSLLRAILMT